MSPLFSQTWALIKASKGDPETPVVASTFRPTEAGQKVRAADSVLPNCGSPNLEECEKGTSGPLARRLVAPPTPAPRPPRPQAPSPSFAGWVWILPGSKTSLLPRSPEKQKAAKRWAVLKGHRLHLFIEAADPEAQLVLELASCEVIVSEGTYGC